MGRFCSFLYSCVEKPNLHSSNRSLLLWLVVLCFVAPCLCLLGVTLAKIQVGLNLLKKEQHKNLNKRAASDFIVRRLRTDSKRRSVPVNRKSFAQERPYVGDR